MTRQVDDESKRYVFKDVQADGRVEYFSSRKGFLDELETRKPQGVSLVIECGSEAQADALVKKLEDGLGIETGSPDDPLHYCVWEEASRSGRVTIRRRMNFSPEHYLKVANMGDSPITIRVLGWFRHADAERFVNALTEAQYKSVSEGESFR